MLSVDMSRSDNVQAIFAFVVLLLFLPFWVKATMNIWSKLQRNKETRCIVIICACIPIILFIRYLIAIIDIAWRNHNDIDDDNIYWEIVFDFLFITAHALFYISLILIVSATNLNAAQQMNQYPIVWMSVVCVGILILDSLYFLLRWRFKYQRGGFMHYWLKIPVICLSFAFHAVFLGIFCKRAQLMKIDKNQYGNMLALCVYLCCNSAKLNKIFICTMITILLQHFQEIGYIYYDMHYVNNHKIDSESARVFKYICNILLVAVLIGQLVTISFVSFGTNCCLKKESVEHHQVGIQKFDSETVTILKPPDDDTTLTQQMWSINISNDTQQRCEHSHKNSQQQLK